MIRIVLASSLVLTGCAKDGRDGLASIDVLEVALDAPMGVQRSVAWTIEPYTTCAAVSLDDHVFLSLGGVSKFARTDLDEAVWSVQIDGIDSCPHALHPTTDGGVMVVSSAEVAPTDPPRTVVTRVDPDGGVAWQRTLADRSGQAPTPASVLLASGGVAIVHDYAPPAGSIAGPAVFVVALDASGEEVRRTEIPRIFIESADSVGTPNGPYTPGTGVPSVHALAEDSSGGILAGGDYLFSRSIQCGSQGDPQDPTTQACGDTAIDGLVAHIDAAGELVWARSLGSQYDGRWLHFFHAAAYPDGGLLVAGHGANDRMGNGATPLVARYDSDGDLEWAEFIPFLTSGFGAIFRGTEATMDLMLVPGGSACRLLRIEPDGMVSRVQLLDSMGGTGNLCMPAHAVGDSIVYAPLAVAPTLVMLAP